MRLASHLSMSLQRCKEETSSTEFNKWNRYLDDEWNRKSKLDYQLANLQAEIKRGYVKHPGRVQADQMFLKFEMVKKGGDTELTEEAIARRMQVSKAAWGAFLGSPIKTQTPPQFRSKAKPVQKPSPRKMPVVKPRR